MPEEQIIKCLIMWTWMSCLISLCTHHNKNSPKSDIRPQRIIQPQVVPRAYFAKRKKNAHTQQTPGYSARNSSTGCILFLFNNILCKLYIYNLPLIYLHYYSTVGWIVIFLSFCTTDQMVHMSQPTVESAPLFCIATTNIYCRAILAQVVFSFQTTHKVTK